MKTISPRIAIDISPLLVQKTGIGYYIENLVRHVVPLKRDFRWSFFAAPRRTERQINLKIGQGDFTAIIKPWFLPSRLTSLLLQFSSQSWVTVETFLGPTDLFHWTNFLCCAQTQGKKVLTVHDISFFLFPQYHPLKRRVMFKWFFLPSLQRADHIIAVSQNTKEDLINHFHVPPKKVTVIHLAADEVFHPVGGDAAHRVLSKYSLTRGQYLLYVGALEPRKNLVRLLKAYTLFRAQGSDGLSLILVGAPGWLNHDFYNEMQRSVWKEDIRVLGYVPKADLPALYSGAVAFIYPSVYEGFGLPPLEAMACGAPVITSRNSSLPEVVGDAAILVDPLSVEEMAKAMLRVADHSSVRAEMREKGLRRAGLFSWEITAKKTVEVYEKTLE